jgi:O-antigen chain-terminating methyltransferase
MKTPEPLPPPDADSIIARVREEARALEREAPLVPPAQDLSAPASGARAIDALANREQTPRPPIRMPRKDAYHRDELLLFDGERFVREAYHAILRREADKAGLQDYLAQLARSGSRQSVLIALLDSAEAKRHGVRVEGLGFARSCLRWTARAQARGLPRFAALARRALLFDEARCASRLAGPAALLGLQQAWREDAHLEIEASRDDVRHEIDGVLQRLKGAEFEFLDRVNGVRDDFRRRLDALLRNHGRLRLEFQTHAEETSAALSLARGDMLYHQAALNRLLRDLADGPRTTEVQRVALAHAQDAIDAYYVAFEDANRGTTEEVRAKQLPYLDILRPIAARAEGRPVCDIGCGRGEWLSLLAGERIAAYGIDANAIMVDRVRGQGLEARHEDALAHLRALPDGALAALTGFHIVEHLPFDVLFGLFEEARRVVMPGGLIVFETPNPENVLVGSHTFYHDFTHRNPVTPAALTFLARYHNFADLRILRLNPYPEAARVPGTDPLTERVNAHLCGPQDFALVAVRPA